MKLYQQVHKYDGGEIVLVADNKGIWQLACKECKALWQLNSPWPIGELSVDFKSYKSKKK
jgi:hypothetical protein